MTGTSPSNPPVFNRSTIEAWGRSIGIAPEIAVAFMEREGVHVVNAHEVTADDRSGTM